METNKPTLTTLHVCGAPICRDGHPHDDAAFAHIRNEDGAIIGGTAVCSRCGQSAMARDLLRLP